MLLQDAVNEYLFNDDSVWRLGKYAMGNGGFARNSIHNALLERMSPVLKSCRLEVQLVLDMKSSEGRVNPTFFQNTEL